MHNHQIKATVDKALFVFLSAGRHRALFISLAMQNE